MPFLASFCLFSFFCLFNSGQQCGWLFSNSGPLVSEATALPNLEQPLPEKIAVFTKMLFKVKSAVDTFWATLGENRLPFIPTSGHTYYISLLAGQKRLIVRRYWS